MAWSSKSITAALCPSVEEFTALCQGKLAWQPEPNSMAPIDPHKLVLATGGQATQDRTTFPVGKLPRRDPPCPLIHLGYESGKVPLALFLFSPPCPNEPVAQGERRGHLKLPHLPLACKVTQDH